MAHRTSAASGFRRLDGPAKADGTARYIADMALPGMAHAAFRYAGVSSARITSIDTSPALAIPGVFAVITADDVPAVRYGGGVGDRTLFADDVVRFDHEVIAAVAASSAAIARQAADAIAVEFEPLTPVTELEDAITLESPLVHEQWQDYEASGVERAGNVASFSSIKRGEPIEAALAQASTVVTQRFVADASQAVPIEPRGVLAQWEGEKVTIWTSTQVPFDARAGVCETLQMPSNRVRIIVPHLGGGFGGKCGFHFEAHIAALARKARRPVRLVFSRREEFAAPDRRRVAMVIDLTTGTDADGSIVARKSRVLIDSGAYIADAAFFPQLAAMHSLGPYQIPTVDAESHLIYTNRQPSGSVRAPTAPATCWALETHTDAVAHQLGIDPLEFRRRNIVRSGSVGPTGQTYGEIGALECLETAAAAAFEADLGPDEAIGVAIGWWPTFAVASGVHVKIDSDGSGQIITGAQECGTGAVMTLPYLVADELGMDPDRFELIYQDTGVAPFDLGATGSQTLVNNGRAAIGAARQIADTLRELAADKLEANVADVILSNGHASVVGSPHVAISIDKLAASAGRGQLLLGHGSGEPPTAPPISGTTCVGDQGVAAWVAPQFSCHAIRIHLDPDTGVVTVLDVQAAHDSGTILNPVGAQGQVHGGIMMGIGQALTESTQFDEVGGQRNPNLTNYKLQTAADAPTVGIHFIEPPTENAGPYGAKGLAEAPNVTTAAAISNAVQKLIGSPVLSLPMTAERIWAERNRV